MAINVAEITNVLKREIAGFEQKLAVSEVGTVIEIGDGIARIYGLRNAMAGELLEFENGTMGQVFNLEEDTIGAVIFGDYLQIKEGDSVKSTRRLELDQLEQLRQRVSRALGRNAVVHQYVDESIIGGIVLRVQDRLIDASVRAQLEGMRRRMLDADTR